MASSCQSIFILMASAERSAVFSQLGTVSSVVHHLRLWLVTSISIGSTSRHGSYSLILISGWGHGDHKSFFGQRFAAKTDGGSNTLNFTINHQRNCRRRSNSRCGSRAPRLKMPTESARAVGGRSFSRCQKRGRRKVNKQWRLFSTFEMFLVLMYVFCGWRAGVETDRAEFASLGCSQYRSRKLRTVSPRHCYLKENIPF